MSLSFFSTYRKSSERGRSPPPPPPPPSSPRSKKKLAPDRWTGPSFIPSLTVSVPLSLLSFYHYKRELKQLCFEKVGAWSLYFSTPSQTKNYLLHPNTANKCKVHGPMHFWGLAEKWNRSRLRVPRGNQTAPGPGLRWSSRNWS